jgi:hypothetical protein
LRHGGFVSRAATLNFLEIGCREQADAVTPKPRFVTQEEHRGL